MKWIKFECDISITSNKLVFQHNFNITYGKQWNLKHFCSIILIQQIHPLGLCNTSDDGDLYEYGWVGVVKLMPPDDLNKPCFTLLEKVILFCHTLNQYITSFDKVFWFPTMPQIYLNLDGIGS